MKYCTHPCIRALLLSGKAAEAIPILEARCNGDLSRAGSGELGRAYALAGRRQDAERVATIQWRPIEQAGIFMALGDKERAIEALQRAIPLGPVRVGRDLTDLQFAAIRGDARVKALRKKLGLPGNRWRRGVAGIRASGAGRRAEARDTKTGRRWRRWWR